ncbi:toxin VasX [Sorangium sp. So ce388]|uniref:toxin VasX n=1 Tax=Sorangium sp. So ce388 TaxID=3133309 RepID=UPI003F5C494F
MNSIELRANTGELLAQEHVLTAQIPPRMVLVFGREGSYLGADPLYELMEDEARGHEAVVRFCESAIPLDRGLSLGRGTDPVRLRAGWLYIRVTLDAGPVWREYEVQADGSLREILFGGPPKDDVREANGNTVYVVLLPWAEVAHVAFSDVQWSKQRLLELDQNQNAREARMQEVRPRPLTDAAVRSSFNDLVSQAVGKERAQLVDFIIKKYGCKYGACATLADRIADADELCWVLQGAWKEMDVLLESLRTGCSPAQIRAGTCAPIDGAADLHDIAVTCYQLGFAGPKNVEELGSKLDRALIEKLLGVEERRVLRERIRHVQENLLNVLENSMYQTALIDFLQNTPSRILRGKALTILHGSWAKISPREKDWHLDVPSKPEEEQERAYRYLRELLDAKNNAGKLWQAAADVAEHATNVKDAAGLIVELLSTYADMNLIADVKSIEVVFNRIQTVCPSALGEAFFIDTWVYQPVLPDGYRLVHQSSGEVTRKFFSAVVVDGSGRPLYTCIPGEETRVRQIFLVESKLARACEELVDSPLIKRIMAVLTAFNLVHALVEFGDDEKSAMRKWTNLLGALANASESYLALRAAVTKPVQWTDEIAEGVGRLVARRVISSLPVIGNAADIVINALDAHRNLTEHDHDAAGAYFAAMVFLAAAFLTSGWAAVALVAAGVSSSILGNLLEDPPLQRFATDGPLRSLNAAGGNTHGGQPPHAFLRDRVDRNAAIVLADQWRSVPATAQWLHDVIYSIQASVQDKREAAPRSPDISVDAVRHVHVEYMCHAFLPGVSKADIFLRIHEAGVGGETKELRPTHLSFVRGRDERRTLIVCHYDLSEERLEHAHPDTVVMMYARVETDAAREVFVPSNQRGTGAARYHASLIPAMEGRDPNPIVALAIKKLRSAVASFSNLTRIGTEEELSEPTFWDP